MSHSPQVLPRPGVERLDSRRALRCVIGMDGSDGAHTAAALASELAWPEGSVLVFVTAVARLPRLPGGEVLPGRSSRTSSMRGSRRQNSVPSAQCLAGAISGIPAAFLAGAALAMAGAVGAALALRRPSAVASA